MRKETLHIYVSMSQKSDFVDLDRFSFCQAFIEISLLSLDRYCFYRGICRVLMKNFSSLVSWSKFHGFNTWLEQHIS